MGQLNLCIYTCATGLLFDFFRFSVSLKKSQCAYVWHVSETRFICLLPMGAGVTLRSCMHIGKRLGNHNAENIHTRTKYHSLPNKTPRG